jgi:hypothetical protein
MKTIILAAAAVAALGCLPAFAEGNGGTFSGSDRWQGANGNPTIPGTEWYNMNQAQRDAKVHQMQQQQAGAIWGSPQTGNQTGVAQTGAAQTGGGHS